MAWRRERADYWRWLWGYRRRALPVIMEAVTVHAPAAELHISRTPRALSQFTAHTQAQAGP